MLKYLVILLDDSSVSFCHYENGKGKNVMSLDTLQKGIMFAMKNDLKIQYVLPKHYLSQEYLDLMDSMFHDNIGPIEQESLSSVIAFNGLKALSLYKDKLDTNKRYLVRTPILGFINDYAVLKDVFTESININIVFTDVDSFSDDLIETYQTVLNDLGTNIKDLVLKGYGVNTNLLTDRIAISEMNNCGAGDTSITLAPNGKFYPCPAFYYENDPYYEAGDIKTGLNLRNQRLFTLEGSPLCKRCDAFHCKRCCWLNKKLTFEVNIPSRQQCVMAHIERNASKNLLNEFHKLGILEDKEINEINYIDPFDEYQRV